jgi:hypothetical protein
MVKEDFLILAKESPLQWVADYQLLYSFGLKCELARCFG